MLTASLCLQIFSHKQEKDDTKSITRAKLELKKVDSQLQVVLAQTNSLRDENHSLMQTLKIEDTKLMCIEQSFKSTIEDVRKELQKELKARILVEGKVMANASELEKMKAEHHRIEEKAEDRMHLIERRERSNSDVVARLDNKKQKLSEADGNHMNLH